MQVRKVLGELCNFGPELDASKHARGNNDEGGLVNPNEQNSKHLTHFAGSGQEIWRAEKAGYAANREADKRFDRQSEEVGHGFSSGCCFAAATR